MRFARVTEEIILRRKELVVAKKDGTLPKSALETLFLYIVILLHSWATGVCELTLPELCEIYELDLDNSYRRQKALRDKGWIEVKKKKIRPILIHRKSSSKTVTVTEKSHAKTVTVTEEKSPKSVMVTENNRNHYSKSGEKTVTVTEKDDATLILANGSSDSRIFKDLKTEDSVSSTDKNKSQFSLEEIFRYIEIRNSKGEKIETPQRYANWAHRSGEMDAFISATLYPPTATEKPIEPQVEYDDEYLPLPLDDSARQNALIILRGLKRDAGTIENLSEYYTAEDWKFFMEELGR